MQPPNIPVTIPATEAPTDLSRARLAIVVGNQIMSVPAEGIGNAFGFQPLDSDLTSWASITRASGFDTFASTPNSANLRSLLSDETGTGAAVFAGAPTITGAAIFSGVPSLAGGGLAFPATQVPSANANTLDDYREGTFTPIIEGLTSAGVGTYTAQTGLYIKVGSLVTFSARVAWTAHTGTGVIAMTGLPFTPSGIQFACSVHAVNLTFTGFLSGRISLSPVITFFNNGTGLAMDTAATIEVSGFYYV